MSKRASEHAYPEHSIDDSIKFDVTNISSQFLGDYLVLQQLNETISKLESSMRSQSDIDCIYTDWCNILKQHMLQNLTHTKRHKNNNNGVYSKKHRPGKPWWSEKLSQLWVSVCKAEKLWLRCTRGYQKVLSLT